MVVKKLKPCGTKSKKRKPKVKKCICSNCKRRYTPKNRKVPSQNRNICDECRVVIKTKRNPKARVLEEEDDYSWSLKQKLAGPNKLPSLKDIYSKKETKENLVDSCPESKFFQVCLDQIKQSAKICNNYEYDSCFGQCSKPCEYPNEKKVSIKTDEDEQELEEEEGEGEGEEGEEVEKPKKKCRCIEEALAARCDPVLNLTGNKCITLESMKNTDGEYIKQAKEPKPNRSRCPEPLQTIRTGDCDKVVKKKKPKNHLCDDKKVVTKLISNLSSGSYADFMQNLSKCKGATNKDMCSSIVADPDPSPWDYTGIKDFKKCAKNIESLGKQPGIYGKRNSRVQCEKWDTDLKEVLKNCKCCPTTKTPQKPNKNCLGHFFFK